MGRLKAGGVSLKNHKGKSLLPSLPPEKLGLDALTRDARNAERRRAFLMRHGDWDGLLTYLGKNLERSINQEEFSKDQRNRLKEEINMVSKCAKPVVSNLEYEDWNVSLVTRLYDCMGRFAGEVQFCEGQAERKASRALRKDIIGMVYDLSSKEIRKLEEKLGKINQLRDQNREKLFRKTYELWYRKTLELKTKRGYGFNVALEEANREHSIIPVNIFRDDFVEINNHFKTWRSRNRGTLKEIEAKVTRV